jgi:hypothetical protein
MKALLLLAMLVVAAGTAHAAEGGFGLSAGVRSLDLGLMLGDTKIPEARGAEATLDGYFTPAKSFPLGATVTASRQSYGLSRASQRLDHLDVTEAAAGISLLPPGGKARPMVRFTYTFLGSMRMSQAGSVTTKRLSGTHFAAGAQVELGKGSLLGFGLDFGQTKADDLRLKSTAAFLGGEIAL